jgi:ligand-binding SRPBCC domain-containing protein
VPILRLETMIRAPVERCFDLARSVDVHQDSTAHTRERAVAGVTAGLMDLGDEVTWEAIHFGIRQRLSSRITELDRPHRFVDEMVRGAFARFRHVHEFRAEQEGTRMIDVFDYTSPLGVLGKLADVLFLRSYMVRLLERRNAHIKALAEASEQADTAAAATSKSPRMG